MIQVHEIHTEITFVPFHERRQCQQHMTKDMANPHLSQWRRGRYGKSAHSAELCRFAATVQVDGACYCRRHAAALVLDLVLSAKEPISTIVRGEQVGWIHDEVQVTVHEAAPDGEPWTEEKLAEATVHLRREDVSNWPVWPVGDE